MLALGLALVAAACGGDAAASKDTELARVELTTTTEGQTTTTAPVESSTTAPPTTAEPTTTAPPATTPPTTAAPTTAARQHSVLEQAWTPYAVVGPVTLHHPSDQVEAIGFHQSGHDGAQPQASVDGSAPWFVMESRDRDTIPNGAADIVVPPGREIRAPVSGVVKRAGTYTLYCDHVDQYAVIEPDGRPGWEVKVLHVEGLALAAGQRVTAGVTPLAAHARVLPFASQVEERTGTPPWPHVHVEVVDPSIPDRPTGPGCP